MLHNLGSKLKKLRLERNMSQDKMCDEFNDLYKTNINKGMVSKWENSKEIPRLDYACKLVKFYETSLDYLLDLNGNDIEENSFTTDELQQIEVFKEFLLSKRKKKK